MEYSAVFAMTVEQQITEWIQSATELATLSPSAMQALVSKLETKIYGPGETVIKEGQPIDGLYILQKGQATRYRRKQPGLTWASSVLPSGAINLSALLLGQPADSCLVTNSECQFYWLSLAQWQQLVSEYPDTPRIYAQRLANKLEQLQEQIDYERDRELALRPYLVTKAKRGIIGSSRYAVKLRQQIRSATKAASVLIVGEPGLEKDNIAALIHFGSDRRRQPVISLKSALLQGSELFGRQGGKIGLLEWLGEGTLILNDVQELPPALLPKILQLLQTGGTYEPVYREGQTPTSRHSNAQLVLIAENAQPQLGSAIAQQIKVPALRVRKTDLAAQTDYYINLICKQKNLQQPQVTPEALRRLQSYDFPGNLRELESLVERAIVQAQGSAFLTEEVFWAKAGKKQLFRWNLLNAYPGLRRWLRSDWYPDRINYGFTAWFFPLIVAILFCAPQDRQHNFVLNIFWAWWWPLILLLFPLIGRLWCAFCPFMIYGEIAQKVSLYLWPRSLQKWPRELADRWGGWFLWAMFAMIFLWEELWNLEDTAYLSGWLLLLITGGAVIFSTIFERRLWCRYLCPIGGMNGLFAKLSVIELRAQQGTCGAECSTYGCYKGGPAVGEGRETGGCPVYSHPAQLTDNKDCVLCMTCLKACPHKSVELNLRPPGIELWTSHQPHGYEVALLYLLLGGIYLHRLPEINELMGNQWNLNNFWVHGGLSIVLLAIPSLLPLLAYGLMTAIYRLRKRLDQPIKVCKPLSFVESSYGYLPLVLGGSLAHYCRMGLQESGRLLPVTAATFGWSGANWPAWVADPAVIAFLQTVSLILGLLTTILLAQKIAKRPFWSLLPQHLAATGLAIGLGLAISSG
jgi:transcriptional regulator with AAA-type ATPase domain/NAD-dependent dihydropyrimidine dehydrogenase PreA subunit